MAQVEEFMTKNFVLLMEHTQLLQLFCRQKYHIADQRV